MKTEAISMKAVILATCVVALLALAPSTAGAEGGLATATALIRSEEYLKAIPLLRQAVAAMPDNPEASYYLGLALNRTTPGKEAEALLKRSLMELPENPGVNYELGLHYLSKEIHVEAADYFKQVMELSPDSDLSRKAAEHLLRINERTEGKNWEISMIAGGQYDSNVILNGRGMPLPQGYSGKDDWSAILNLRAKYAPIKSDQSELAIGYNIYQSLHASLKDFDITQNLVDVSGTLALGSNLKLNGLYSYENLLLHGNSYDTSHSLAPGLLVESAAGTTYVGYRLRTTTFTNSALFPTNSDRNGTNHLLSIRQIYPLTDTTAIWGIYSHDLELTRKTAWEYDGNRLLIGGRSALPFGIVGEGSGEVYWKDYRGVDPQFVSGAIRHDIQYSLSLSLNIMFNETFGMSLCEIWARNHSNIPEFAYERSITSLLLTARF